MLREKLVTIIIGLVVGALIAGAYFFGPQLLNLIQNQNTPGVKTPVAKTVSPTPKPKKTELEIVSPENNSSTTESEIKIKGTASPNTKLVLFGNADEKEIISDKDGKFETTFKLEEGENEIAVTALTETLQTININVTLEITE